MPLLIAFIAVPLIEIALFIQVGGAIGLWPTLLVVVITAVLGTYLVRQQGRLALSQVQQSFSELNDPSEPLAHGAMILFAGALLLTPGFFTDAVGFLLLMPPVRTRAFAWVRTRVNVQSFQMGGAQARGRRPDSIDGEFEDVEPEPRRSDPDKPSGWTRH